MHVNGATASTVQLPRASAQDIQQHSGRFCAQLTRGLYNSIITPAAAEPLYSQPLYLQRNGFPSNVALGNRPRPYIAGSSQRRLLLTDLDLRAYLTIR